jgi:hypothetical protein
MRLATIFVCLLAATAVACDESPTGPSVSVDARFTLSPGQTASVQGRGITLRLDEVTGDSRCPGDAVCITGGDAIVKVTASGDGNALTLDLHTGDASRASVTYGSVKVSLVELQPYPFGSLPPIKPGDYRATLVVSVK